MEVSTATLAVRLLGFAAVLVGAPLFFVLLFRGLDFVALDGLGGLVENWADGAPSGERGGTGRSLPEDTVVCPHCGAHNDATFTLCGNCQGPLGG
jgi:hypothetical protein